MLVTCSRAERKLGNGFEHEGMFFVLFVCFFNREAKISRIYNFLWHIKNNFLDELTEAGLCSKSEDFIFASGWSGNL